MFFFPSPTYSLVPLNSLKCKCLSKLASMMRKPEPDPKSTNEFHPPVYRFDPESKNALNLPIEVVQQILDYIVQERIKIRFEVLCGLLSNRGCLSLNLNSFGLEYKEMKESYGILPENCIHLRSLVTHRPSFKHLSSPFKEKSFIGLQYLDAHIGSLDELAYIFAACPNLVQLGSVYIDSPSQEKIIDTFCELKKPAYNQIRQSIQAIMLEATNAITAFKLIALLPNLTCLEYKNSYLPKFPYAMLTAIKNLQDEEQMIGSIQHFAKKLGLCPDEIKEVLSIFSKLRVLRGPSSSDPDVFVLTPNIEKLAFHQLFKSTKSLSNIGNLKNLKSLSVNFNHAFIIDFPQILYKVLKQIGDNLEQLHLWSRGSTLRNVSFDVSTIALYCPNLKHFAADGDCILHNQSQLDQLNMSMQERENLTRPFRHLKILELAGHDLEGILFTYILKHAVNIEIIHTRSIQITERHLAEITRTNPLKNLRVLDIYGNDIISESFFTQLINSLDKLCCAKYESHRMKTPFMIQQLNQIYAERINL